MTDQTEPDGGSRGAERGFTLIEMLIVMTMMGVLASALAMTISIVLRTSPAAEDRVDDARSVQGLVTWLPQDVDATPPDQFNTDPAAAWPCDGAAPSNSYNVVTMRWSERTSTTTNFAATYRYEFDGSSWRILRYTCEGTGSSMILGRTMRLTDALPSWDNLAPPARVTMCSTAIDNNGNCPSGSEITTTTASNVESLTFRLTRLDGVDVVIDAAPKNPDEDLADDPNASGNSAPSVSQTDFVVDLLPGETITIDLNATHSPTDADGDTLSVAIDSSEPLPLGITASTSDPLNVTLTADASLPPGIISDKLVLIISDPRAGWVDPTLTINIESQPNVPPTLSSPTYAVQLAPGQAAVLPIDVTHGVSDPNGDPLTVTVSTWPTVRVQEPTFDDPSQPLAMTIAAKGTATIGAALIPITFEVSDGLGGVATGEITVEVVTGTSNTSPTAVRSNIDIELFAGEPLAISLDDPAFYEVSDADADPLAASIAVKPSELTATLLGGVDVELTADAGIVAGPLSSQLNFLVEDGRGGTINLIASVTILPTPEPPSDCVLGSLTASPTPVQRQGNSSSPRHLRDTVLVELTTTGDCDGLVLKYDTGDTSGLGIGTGRVFTDGSPHFVEIRDKSDGGTEKWLSGTFTLTATTTSDVTPNSVTTTLTVD